MFYIGCHLSVAGGFAAMGRDALKVGANVFQYFTRNPRGGKAKDIDPADIEAYLDLAKQNGFGKILAHASYTINPCSADTRTRDFADDFAQSLSLLDDVILLDIYPAREEPIPGITSEVIFEKVTSKEKILLKKAELLDFLENKQLDVLVTLGAGDIEHLLAPIKKLLEKRSIG